MLASIRNTGRFCSTLSNVCDKLGRIIATDPNLLSASRNSTVTVVFKTLNQA